MFFIPNIDALLALIQKIFPDENCTQENITAYLRRLAIKDIRQDEWHFAPVEPGQMNRGGAYAPEKIAPNPSPTAMLEEPYATFHKMRRISVHQGEYMRYYADESETFCRQARFMEDFTDDWGDFVPLNSYDTTYGKMNDSQLRTYFTWRTKARRGMIENTSPSYAFCYLFELLNDIGVKSAADAMEKLIGLWTAFRQYCDHMDHYMRIWIRDYYVSHKTQLTAEFFQYSSHFPVPYHGTDLELLAKAKACAWNELRVIEASSSFKITNGTFYKTGNREIIEQCACYIFRELAQVFKSGGVDFRKLFFEIRRQKIYSLYQGAVHPDVAASPITVELDAYETMKYNSSGWHRAYVSLTPYRPVVGYILKLAEVKMRRHFGYKKNLQEPKISTAENCFLNSEPERFSWPSFPSIGKLEVWKGSALAIMGREDFGETIARAVSNYCTAEHIVVEGGTVKVIKPVEIDLSKLKEIEKDHAETVKKLVVTDYDVPFSKRSDSGGADGSPPISKDAKGAMPAAVQFPSVTGMYEFIAALPDESKAFLTAILEGQAPPNSEILIESINEKALQAISDSLIDYGEGAPYVYCDYIDDLKASLGGK